MLLSFKQESAADHVENVDVLKALGLSTDAEQKTEAETESDGASGGVVCEGDVCTNT